MPSVMQTANTEVHIAGNHWPAAYKANLAGTMSAMKQNLKANHR